MRTLRSGPEHRRVARGDTPPNTVRVGDQGVQRTSKVGCTCNFSSMSCGASSVARKDWRLGCKTLKVSETFRVLSIFPWADVWGLSGPEGLLVGVATRL